MLDKVEQCVEQIVSACSDRPIWVAYSGGVDSHVLLHLLATAKQNLFPALPLHAIHIDHGLNQKSHDWSEHCQQEAEALSVDYHSLKVKVTGVAEHGLEAAARQARYQALVDYLPDNAVLLTAQHQSDQTETLLLQLLRGAGPKGLAGMKCHSRYQTLSIYRPFLSVSKKDILSYAQQHGLNWIEDPSNSETEINRNYLRHKVWPIVEHRWPSAEQTISRSAEHCGQADELLSDLARIDLASLDAVMEIGCLSIPALLALSDARRRNVLRYFIQQLGLTFPSSQVLERVFDELCVAKEDRNPIVAWSGGELRRYRNKLFGLKPIIEHDQRQVLVCDSQKELILSSGQVIQWQQTDKDGIPAHLFSRNLTLRFRQGGERIQLTGDHHSSLKHLFQQWAIPPWLRNRIPLIFNGDELVAVVGYGLSDLIQSTREEPKYIPVIK